MASNTPGTDSDPGEGGSYLWTEAQCVDGYGSLDEMFDMDDPETDLIDLVDNASNIDQGNSASLLNQQLLGEGEEQIQAIKRKLNLTPSPSPEVLALSPRLASVSLSPCQRRSKRRLFEDSGIEAGSHETEESPREMEQVRGSSETERGEHTPTRAEPGDILRAANRHASFLARFKDRFGVSYCELVRTFKSDKTTCNDWVVCAWGVSDELMEASKQILVPHCEYIQLIDSCGAALYLFSFKAGKSRECVRRLMASTLGINALQLFIDPPRVRSMPTALYFYQKTLFTTYYRHGQYPDWLASQTLVSHQTATDTFDLSKMVQFAYDNNYLDECTVAFHYALEADTDPNAAAWLKLNNQARMVKDATTMVRFYKKQEMRNMSMAEWVWKCCDDAEGEGESWMPIRNFLQYQEVNFVSFLTVLRFMFNNTPKQHCMLIYGPPDSGKSYFCNTLIHFLQGRVISFLNRNSHFWLSPLAECKVGFLDDATEPAWHYIDINMRTALDGNPFCIDQKFRAPMQIKLPPLFITSNVDIYKDETYRYLHSRIKGFKFPKKFPLNRDGTPVYQLTDAHWKSFFTRLAKQLNLSPREDEGDDNEPRRTFRCSARERTDIN
uniref:Replication protein E1 n=1 Tax=Eidolon bat papillomavirus TaxID=3141875 RepID=A0AAU7E2I3_9PAPI